MSMKNFQDLGSSLALVCVLECDCFLPCNHTFSSARWVSEWWCFMSVFVLTMRGAYVGNTGKFVVPLLKFWDVLVFLIYSCGFDFAPIKASFVGCYWIEYEVQRIVVVGTFNFGCRLCIICFQEFALTGDYQRRFLRAIVVLEWRR